MGIDAIEAMCLGQPQVDCNLVHHFGPGLYMREVTIPAGTFVVGMSHRFAVQNIMIKGRIVLYLDDGPREYAAPMVFVSPPGRKVAYALDDVVWMNVYPTEETDIDVLEEMYIEKSEARLLFEEAGKIAGNSAWLG